MKPYGVSVTVTGDSNHLMTGALDALTAPVCVLDGSGVIVAVNQAWREFSASNGGSGDYLGQNYLLQCESSSVQAGANANALADGIRAVIRGDLPEYSHEYPCHTPAEQRWFSARVSRFRDGAHVVAHQRHQSARLRRSVNSSRKSWSACSGSTRP